MKKTMSEYDFINEFEDIRPNNFTRAGLIAVYDYLIEYEESCDTEIEFDPIAICCEYTEYEDIAEFNSNYGKDYEEISEIEYHTTVIMIDDISFIIQDY